MTESSAPLVAVARGGPMPLSFAQRRLWLLDQLEPISWTYNVAVVRRLHGRLRVDALRRALDTLVARHEILRTVYPAVEGVPMQVIGAPRPCALRVVDVSRHVHPDAEARRQVGVETRRRFELAAGPAFRALVVRIGAEEWILVLTMHHIATDEWSEALMLGEISVLYNAFARDEPSPFEPQPLQYADFAAWQRASAGESIARHLEYWVRELDGLPPLLDVLGDRPRPHRRSGRGARVELLLAPELAAGLRRIAHDRRATMFMTLLAAFEVLLARSTGEHDIVVGTPIANRTRRETSELLGFFANTLALRTDLSGDPTFLEALARVRAGALGAYSHQDAPFEQVVQALAPERSPGHTALFQHMFGFQTEPELDLRFEGLVSTALEIESGTAMFDLSMHLRESGDAIGGWLEYATDLYDRATAERFARHFTTLLGAIVAEPAAAISAYDLMGADERQRMLVTWNATGAPFPDRCIHEQFAEIAAGRPDAIALVGADESITYRELDTRANRLAALLHARGVGVESRVGIHLPRSLDAVVALLATLKAGGAYVPLDPSYPAPRLRFMIEDAGIDIVVARGAAAPAAYGGAPVERIDVDDARDATLPAPHPNTETTSDALAFVLYTSGSTGSPKGVMIEHRSVMARLFGVDYFDFDAAETMLHLAPLSFDAATFEIWGALLHGSRCVVAPDEPFSLERFGSLMRTGSVDALCLTPALFDLVVEEHWRDLAGVRQLVVGGDVLSPAHAARALGLLPALRLVNGYGPTEATTDALCHDVRPEDAQRPTVPIGRPIANTEAYIVDPAGRPVPVGVVGELLIGGAGLARGYLGRPELTAERFVRHPFADDPSARVYRTGDRARYRADGTVEFIGRADGQVKIRGFRVEPAEVEAVLRDLHGVAAAAVVVRDDVPGRRLVAYVVASAAPRSPRDLRDDLRARLPPHLVPAAIVPVDALPVTRRGKLDRAALPPVVELFDTSPVPELMTPTERAQITIWREILGVEHVGIDDNFFALGGDSLLAAVLLARTARRTGRDIPLALMFSSPTVREIARAIDSDGHHDATVVPLQPAGAKPALVVGHTVGGLLFRYTGLVRHLDPEQPVFGLRPPDSALGGRRLRLEDLASRYRDDILRLRTDGPYCLAGFCFGGIVMIEVAHQLEALGHTVAVLALFDAEPTDIVQESRPRREAAQLAALVRGEETTATYLRRRVANVRLRLDGRPRLADYVRVRRDWWSTDGAGAGEPTWPLERSLARAAKSYVVPATACPLTLFRAGDPTVAESAVRFLPGGDRTYVIDGPDVSHDTLMDEPHVAALASALTDVLERARADAAPSFAVVRAPDRNARGLAGDGERGGVIPTDVESA